MAKISVLIPVYNGEKTIEKTINSVLSQSFKDFELIVVDDGSIDGTKNVVASFEDERIRYYYKENGGIADTRNCLISKANAEYISFIDADDYMEKDTLESLYNEIIKNEADVAVCDYRYVYEDNTSKDMISLDFKPTNIKECPELLVRIMPQFWNKLIKKELFDVCKTEFPKGLVFEDLYLYACLIIHAKKICKVNKVLFNYVQLDSSIMSNTRKIKQTIYDIVPITDEIYVYYHDNNFEDLNYELEGLLTLNIRELVDSVFKNQTIDIKEKVSVSKQLLVNLNKRFPKWYNNEYYREKYVVFGSSFMKKRKLIDILLQKGFVYLVCKYILRG